MSSLPQDFNYDSLKDRNYKATDFNVNKDLAKGPMQNRKCTDMCCCLIFLVFIGAMITMTGYGAKYGQVEAILAPVDGDSRICGFSPEVKDHPYLYLANLSSAMANPSLMFNVGSCVKECPTKKGSTIECIDTKKTSGFGGCASKPIYGTTKIPKLKYCIPDTD
jgi:hypothetical protein